VERLLTYSEALHEATAQAMREDPRVIVLGLGVDDHRGIYGTTGGLAEEFGADRVFDTPLSEDAMTGVAIGAALAGLRPVHVHIRMDFVLLAMNQLVNVAAKSRYMSGGTVSVPLVVRAIVGRSWGQGAQHSQALHAMFMHVPGLRVVAPSAPYDAKGCLTAAIRDGNPVIFMEHRMLHRNRGHVPAETYEVPFGRARVLAPGRDLTIVGISHMVVECLRARHHLAEVRIDAEVIDPVSLAPLDVAGIAASVERTGALLVVDNGWPSCGAGAEIITSVLERLGGRRAFRCRRMGFAPVPCPTTRNLEQLFYPSASSIATAAHELIRGEGHATSAEGRTTIAAAEGRTTMVSAEDRPPMFAAAAGEPPEIREFKGPF
jgi:pyruvate/2-oxoglutarate/acetoin dehydrogenase E1 component